MDDIKIPRPYYTVQSEVEANLITRKTHVYYCYVVIVNIFSPSTGCEVFIRSEIVTLREFQNWPKEVCKYRYKRVYDDC